MKAMKTDTKITKKRIKKALNKKNLKSFEIVDEQHTDIDSQIRATYALWLDTTHIKDPFAKASVESFLNEKNIISRLNLFYKKNYYLFYAIRYNESDISEDLKTSEMSRSDYMHIILKTVTLAFGFTQKGCWYAKFENNKIASITSTEGVLGSHSAIFKLSKYITDLLDKKHLGISWETLRPETSLSLLEVMSKRNKYKILAFNRPRYKKRIREYNKIVYSKEDPVLNSLYYVHENSDISIPVIYCTKNASESWSDPILHLFGLKPKCNIRIPSIIICKEKFIKNNNLINMDKLLQSNGFYDYSLLPYRLFTKRSKAMYALTGPFTKPIPLNYEDISPLMLFNIINNRISTLQWLASKLKWWDWILRKISKAITIYYAIFNLVYPNNNMQKDSKKSK